MSYSKQFPTKHDCFYCIRKICSLLSRLIADDASALPFNGSGLILDSGHDWRFSPEMTDLALWEALKKASARSTADVRSLVECSEHFAVLLSEAAKDNLAQLPLVAVSCFRCSLRDSEIIGMADRAECDDFVQEIRSPAISAFIEGFWRSVFILLCQDKLACKSFFDLSEKACTKLLEISNKPNVIYNFIHMRGHKFELSCSEKIFASIIKSGKYSIKNAELPKDGRKHSRHYAEKYYKESYVYLTGFQQACGRRSFDQYKTSGNIQSEALIPRESNSTKTEEEIMVLLKEGYNDAEIMKRLKISKELFHFYKNRLEKQSKFKKRPDSLLSSVGPFKQVQDIFKTKTDYNVERYEYVRELMAEFLSFLGFSKTQVKTLFGVSDARSKRYRSQARKCGFIDKHCEPKYSTLDWQLLCSIFIANYRRIGDSKVMSNVDPIAEHEAYTAIVRGIEAAPVLKARFWPYLQGNDNFVQLAMELRQGHVCLEFCDICKCCYAKTYDTTENAFTGGCPFCEFRDTFVFRTPTGA